MKPLTENVIDRLIQAERDEECAALREQMRLAGYAGFRRFLDEMKERLESFDENGAEPFLDLLQKAEKVFPSPGEFSPSWSDVWEEFRQIAQYKMEVFQEVPARLREGEWQVLMDNPFTNQQVVCYPGLDFMRAAYLYSYFRPQMKKNEYIRLQKVEQVIMHYGN